MQRALRPHPAADHLPDGHPLMWVATRTDAGLMSRLIIERRRIVPESTTGVPVGTSIHTPENPGRSRRRVCVERLVK